MPESLPGVDIAQMDFHRGEFHPFDGVPDRNARVRVSGGIDHQPLHTVRQRLRDGIDDHAFMIALHEAERHSEFSRDNAQPRLNFRERHDSIYFYFPAAKQLQVGPVQY